ncbi:MAG: class I SAM-dependent methyltransferase [Chloroflexi bacterium]|nr:class I SAM-dependent methyltransferase [Chloroflexota bacterium]
MTDYDAATYGDRIAEVYDDWYVERPDPSAMVAALAELAGAGPVLELGVGTGRVALPLATQGLAVHGIDASAAMVAKLRAKPSGDAIPVTMGDFAEVGVAGRFSLIFVVFNTFFALLSQADQVRCFRNAADHLTDEGVFVVEAFVPDLSRFQRGHSLSVESVRADLVLLNAAEHDPLQQRIVSQHLVISDDSIRLYPVQMRYAWPAELDLMARQAGLRLRERWADWDRQPFGPSSTRHVSIYGRSGARSQEQDRAVGI